ncbi:asparagine synthase (glutamine-hydrolyzing) [Shewanella algae]|uniref:asparagine synthase (glutamine-hydrolyzing) n=1 Tax=Shewanella algae TaxID=38313 RepID=UPI001AAE02E8|nr:asparagine synthase (glutamine-hydrolyzing) [Shewanella algae]MBO2657666.1 asparagine synthase (glutamine-hydrolyzing) [Shewanella algae]
MCGFTGFISSSTLQNKSLIVSDMLQKIFHRGPDDFGIWEDETISIGHRRLSIHDLSSLGKQPMQSVSGRYCIVFNGEIYNFKELKSALEKLNYKFLSTSDTEVLLCAIEEWGLLGALNKFVGMFAFALWDKSLKKLHLVRDRMGEKPLYYYIGDDSFIFGSQLNSLVCHPKFVKKICRSSLALFLRHGYIPAPFSIYEKAFKLSPGQYITIDACDGHFSVNNPVSYWSVKSNSICVPDEPQGILDELDALISNSVRLQSKADVSVGAFLSGGIDSSLVAAYMQEQSSRPINTFTIGFNDKQFNEAKFAKEIASHLGTEHTEHYIAHKDLLSIVPQMATVYDEPFADSSQLPTYLVGALAKEKVTVALSGDGGDELFCGYKRYSSSFERWKKVERIPSPIRSLVGAVSRSIPLKYNLHGKRTRDTIRAIDYIGSSDFNIFYKRSVSSLLNINSVIDETEFQSTVYDEVIESGMSLYRHMMNTDMQQYLPDDILVKVDRAYMASSLEGRIPLLDHRIVEFSLGVPISVHRFDGHGKYLLRQLLYRKVPERLLDRPKMGFAIPLDEWLRVELLEWAEDLLCPIRLQRDGFFDVAFISKIWKQHKCKSQNWGTLLWSVLMFNNWFDAQ